MAVLGEPPTPPLIFLVVPLMPVREKPGIPWQGGEAAGSTPWQAVGMFPWGWDPAGCRDWGGGGQDGASPGRAVSEHCVG